jgi:hypothetical protein
MEKEEIKKQGGQKAREDQSRIPWVQTIMHMLIIPLKGGELDSFRVHERRLPESIVVMGKSRLTPLKASAFDSARFASPARLS